jgi:hypothetical protein
MDYGTVPKERRASMGRRQRKCPVCHHPQRKEIEQEYLRWRSPAAIAREYGLTNARKWIVRPGVRIARGVNRLARCEINAAIADQLQDLSNRESAELKPDATS